MVTAAGTDAGVAKLVAHALAFAVCLIGPRGGGKAALARGPDGSVLARFSAPPGSGRVIARDECLMAVDGDGVWSVEAWRAATTPQRSHGSRRPFVAMHTGTGPGTPAEQARLTLELGFDGIAWGSDRVSDLLATCLLAAYHLLATYEVLEHILAIYLLLTCY